MSDALSFINKNDSKDDHQAVTSWPNWFKFESWSHPFRFVCTTSGLAKTIPHQQGGALFFFFWFFEVDLIGL